MKTTISPEPALLGFLVPGPLHGYDLYKQVTRQLGAVWHLGLSQLYAIVNEYSARGWIQTRVELQGKRPPKKILELTPAGRAAFDEWLGQSAHGLREFRVDFFARLYFARTAGRKELNRLLKQQRAASERELEKLKQADLTDDGPDDDFGAMVRHFRIEQLKSILKWLELHHSDLVPEQTRANRHAPKNRSAPPSK